MPFFKLPSPIAKCAPRCRTPGPCLPRKFRKFKKFRKFRKFLACTTSRLPHEGEKSKFFKRPFTKMAASVVGGWESGWGLAGAPSAPKNAGIYFRTSSSCVVNNPSLQIRSFCDNGRKCYRTCDPTNGLSAAVLIRQDLHVADGSYFSCDEAYKHSVTLSSHLLSMPCWEGKPNGRQFFAEIFIK